MLWLCVVLQAVFVEFSFAWRSTEDRSNDGVLCTTLLWA